MTYDILTKPMIAAIAATLLMGASSDKASASTITADYTVGPNVSAKITSSSHGSMNVLAARFEMDTTTGENFFAYCVDLAHAIADGVTYTVGSIADSGFSKSAVTDIDRLFTSFYDKLGDDNTMNAGFQLALWEIVDETAGATYDLYSGNFAVSSRAAQQGQSFLDNLGDETGGYVLSFFDTDTNQSLVGTGFDSAVPDTSPVPVPAALPLLLTGLGGMAFLRRKSKRKAA